MIDKTLKYSFYLLFGLTPLIWYSHTSELFEINKMFFVYGLTILIAGTFLIRMVASKSFLVKRSPLDIPLVLFLASQLLSTIYSIDPHTSIFGYYSRLNGGLLSTISYLVLFRIFISVFNKDQVITALKAALLGGAAVSLYAIPEHFGVSPSCILLTGQANASCWVQLVQQRVFATLGQPNWLAAYLAMLIFPALYFALTAENLLKKASYCLLATSYYLAFNFTYTRGATLGLLAGAGVFVTGLVVLSLRSQRTSASEESLRGARRRGPLRPQNRLRLRLAMTLGIILVIFLLINLLFGSALTQFSLVKQYAAPTRESLVKVVTGGTQLENGGTESSKIRFIVWQGALNIFRHSPVLGSGVETFAYAYYQFRPAAHNLTSEWDFLYNKAHNEYLNFLATTGILGLGSYLLVVAVFVGRSLQLIVRNKSKPSLTTGYQLLATSLLASYVANLVANFFLFSIVITNLFFFLFPAVLFVYSEAVTPIKTPRIPLLNSLFKVFNSRRVYQILAIGVISVVVLVGLLEIRRLWLADFYYAQGVHKSEVGNPGQAYNKLARAFFLNPFEPLYSSELSYAGASAAVAIHETDATLSGELAFQSAEQAQMVIDQHPFNVSLLRTAIRTYYLLATLNPTFTNKTLLVLDRAIKLAPTDPKLLYNKAIIEGASDATASAIADLEKTILLKADYRDAHYALGVMYFQQGQKDRAIQEMKNSLAIDPGDAEAQEKLKLWNK